MKNKERQPKQIDKRASKRQKIQGGKYKEKNKKKKEKPTIDIKGKRKEDEKTRGKNEDSRKPSSRLEKRGKT